MINAESEFLLLSASRLLRNADRIEDCVRLLTPEQIWLRHSENENAIGNLLLHLRGNVRQWILTGVGGEVDQRDRDSEFTTRSGADAAALLAGLRATVTDAAKVIGELNPARLQEKIFPQGYDVTVMGAIYHVVEHFSGHTFQVILLTKLFTGKDLAFYPHLTGQTRGQTPDPSLP